MPKHYIYPRPNPDGSNADRRLELHWQRDGSVQVAATRWAGSGEPDTAIEYLAGQSSVNEPAPAWPGEFVDLDRGQINHLIQQLRTARDQAYGRDQ